MPISSLPYSSELSADPVLEPDADIIKQEKEHALQRWDNEGGMTPGEVDPTPDSGKFLKMRKAEPHRMQRIGWLRAAVLGANDGIVSTASLIVGVAAAESSRNSVLVAGLAGLVAGAMSMAAGEYVSVSSQADSEGAELNRERVHLATGKATETAELAAIYVTRGLDPGLASQVATQLMSKDALGAHARDELGITETMSARPVQAALASAGSFVAGGTLPLILVFIVPVPALVWTVSGSSLLILALLGYLAARAGGSQVRVSIGRITFWGALAMALTAGVGTLFGTVL